MSIRNDIKGFLRSQSWRFWVIAGYVLIVAVFIAVWSWSLFGPLNGVIRTEQVDSLTAIAQAGTISLEDTDRDAESVTIDLVQGTELRATIVASDGTVLGDSDNDPTKLENHLSRPEVQAALSGQVGTDERTSVTNGDPELYVAVPATYQDRRVALRISAPVSTIRNMSESIRASSLALLLAGVIIAVFVGWRSYASATHPMNRLERVRTDFVANASHELKTPVAGIRLLSDAISNAAGDGDLDRTRAFASRLDAESARLQHLVTDLLDLSRLENSDLRGAAVRSDLRSAVTTSIEAHRGEAERRGIRLEFEDHSQEGDNCYALIDASDASLIIDNLLENAIRYTEQGSVTVRFMIDDNILVLKVEDTGIGIPSADQSRIFERFYRVDTARSRELGGTGLGLSLVRHAVKRGGGTVTVDSHLGEGTSFTVRIPQAR